MVSQHKASMGGQLFKEVASVTRLKKKDFKPADKTPRTYSRQPFSPEGRMDLDITFGDKTMQTPVRYTLKWMLLISCCFHRVCVDNWV